VTSQGGTIIFVYKIARLVGCLVLVALTIVTLVTNDYEDVSTGKSVEALKKKRKGRKKNHPKDANSFSGAEWLQISLCLAYVSSLLYISTNS